MNRLTEDQINYHKRFIGSMNLYSLNAFLKCAHKDHMYYSQPFTSIIKEKLNGRIRTARI